MSQYSSVRQAIVVDVENLSEHGFIEKIALFNPDGSPFSTAAPTNLEEHILDPRPHQVAESDLSLIDVYHEERG